jgi:hypothetical protein
MFDRPILTPNFRTPLYFEKDPADLSPRVWADGPMDKCGVHMCERNVSWASDLAGSLSSVNGRPQ